MTNQILVSQQWRNQDEAEETMPPETPATNVLRFVLVLYINFPTVKEASVTDDVTDCPSEEKSCLRFCLTIDLCAFFAMFHLFKKLFTTIGASKK